MTEHTKAEVILQVNDVQLIYDRPILRDNIKREKRFLETIEEIKAHL